MSGGGGTTVQKSDPWSGQQPYLKDVMGQGAANYYGGGPAYYPGQTFVGPTTGQIGGWDTQLNYADQVFGGQQAPQFGQATEALGKALAGNTTLGSMANTLSPVSSNAISSSFANPFGTAGGLDARGAITGALSGTPDYGAVGNAVGAANTQQFNQLYNEVIPQLNQRASFLGNPSGSIKNLNSAISNLTQNQNLNAQQAYLGEFNRAKAAQENAAGLVSQGGLSTQSNVLGLGGLAGNLAAGAGDQSLRGVSTFPLIAQTGAIPGQLSSQFADWGAGYQDMALQDQLNRYNYYQGLPAQNLGQYSSIINGYGGLGSVASTTPPAGARWAGAAGGALSGAALGSALAAGGGAAGGAASGAAAGSIVPGWGSLIGAGIGALGGYFASDRRLKTDITRVGTLESGLGVYRYRFKGDQRFQIGVMSDEVTEKFPHAVVRSPQGFDLVDYSQVA